MFFPWFFPTVSQALTDVPSAARGAGPGAGRRPLDGRGQMGGTLRGATGTREALEDGAWDEALTRCHGAQRVDTVAFSWCK